MQLSLPRTGTLSLLAIPPAVLVALLLLQAPDAEPAGPLLVYTQIPVTTMDASSRGQLEDPFPEKSRIAAVRLSTADSVHVLTGDFVSARAPTVSYDGRRLLFSGKRSPDEPWQIWELHLESGAVHQVTEGLGNCTDPFYLPDRRIAFSAEGSREGPLALYTERKSSSGFRRITFHPRSDRNGAILPDGRIVFSSASTTGTPGSRDLFATRYDGTQAELFYRAGDSVRIVSRARPVENRILFVEDASPDDPGGELVEVALERPLHTRTPVRPDKPARFEATYPEGSRDSSGMVTSYWNRDNDTFDLYTSESESSGLSLLSSSSEDDHELEPVVVRDRRRPTRFLSPVDTTKSVGWLYGLNAHRSNLPASGRGTPPATRLQVVTQAETLGTTPLKEGSFYIEVPADTPLRFRTLDADGRAVRGPSAWVWVRPNEYRGCIGCHEDREVAPPNKIPRAVTDRPVPLSPSQSSSNTPTPNAPDS